MCPFPLLQSLLYVYILHTRKENSERLLRGLLSGCETETYLLNGVKTLAGESLVSCDKTSPRDLPCTRVLARVALSTDDHWTGFMRVVENLESLNLQKKLVLKALKLLEFLHTLEDL